MASLYAQKNLSTAQASLSQSVQRLSSGTRISSAKDDAAGFGISQSLMSTKNIVDQNIRNAQNGISWTQTADGALDVVGKILQRALTLTTQKTDATLNTDQTAAVNAELLALEKEINNIAVRTKFQGGSTQLSTFGSTVLETTAGANIGLPVVAIAGAVARFNTITVDTGSGTPTSITATMINPGTAAAPLSGKTVGAIQTLIAENATNRGALGAAQNSLQYAIDNMQTLSNNLADGVGRIVDTDYASETANLTKTQILQQAATSMLAQANQMPNVILTLLK
jgi:flagellin